METEHLITFNSIFQSFHFLATLMEIELNNFPLVFCFRNVQVPKNLLFSCSRYITITESGWLNGPSRGNFYYYILKIIQIGEEYTYQGYLFHDLYNKWLFFNSCSDLFVILLNETLNSFSLKSLKDLFERFVWIYYLTICSLELFFFQIYITSKI